MTDDQLETVRSAAHTRRLGKRPTPAMRAALLEWMAHGESKARALLPPDLSDDDRAWFNAWIARNMGAIRAYRLISFTRDGNAQVDRAPFLRAWGKGRHRA